MPKSKKNNSKKFSLNDLKNKSNQHFHFIVVLVLFSAFSMFTMLSFFHSNSNYLNLMTASVMDSSDDSNSENGADLNDALDENGTDANSEDGSDLNDDFDENDSVDDSENGADLNDSLDENDSVDDSENGADLNDSLDENDSVDDSDLKSRHEVFSDLYSDDDSAEEVEKLYELGVINGYPDGSFKPANSINRAELLTILTNAVDADLSGQTLDNCFVDVKSEWFAPFVCYAKVSNWVKGYEDGSYRPASPVIRAEALKIVLESFDYEIPEALESPYSDVDPSDWYAGYVLFARDAGILEDRQFFNAIEEIDRAEFVQMVYNAMNYKGLF